MKITRKIPLLYCILSMTYMAGCTLEEPNDLDLRCHDDKHQLSQIIYTTINNNSQSENIHCPQDTHKDQCLGMELNFEKGFCPLAYGCIKNESDQSGVFSCVDSIDSYFNGADPSSICDGDTHLVKINENNQTGIDKNRCSAIEHEDSSHKKQIIGYCCKDDVEHCGTEDENCKNITGWKTGSCINKDCKIIECDDDYKLNGGSCEKLECEASEHINDHACVADTDEVCGASRTDCTSIEFEPIPHASSTLKCIDGSCRLKCEENYQASEDNRYCYSDSDVEHCGIENSNCNILQTSSNNGFHGFACVDGRCSPKCEDGFVAHIPDAEDNSDSYYCEANCNNITCGPNQSCSVYDVDKLYGYEKRCALYNGNTNECVRYEYYKYSNIDGEAEVTPINEGVFVDIESKDEQDESIKCLELTNVKENELICTYYEQFIETIQENRCDCIEGYENVNGKCIPTCNSDGYIDTYWNGEIKKARCIKNANDLELMRPESWEDDGEEKIFYFADNIDLGKRDNWEPIGSTELPFKGIIMGNNQRIQGTLTCQREDGWCGVFGRISSSYIYNLYLDMNITNNSESVSEENNSIRMGMLAANASDSYFYNINASGMIHSKNVSAGGILGAGSTNTLSGCTFSGSIDSNQSVGGIVGMQIKYFILLYQSLYYTEFSNCRVSGTLKGRTVGGIIGKASINTIVDISHSSFSGTIEGNIIGGLIGESSSSVSIDYSSVINSDLVSSVFTEELSSSSSGVHMFAMSLPIAGGLIGSGLDIAIDQSFVNDTIIRGSTSGGLLGQLSSTNDKMYASIKSSYFNGVIRSSLVGGGLVGSALKSNQSYRSKIITIEESAVFGRIYGTLSDDTNERTASASIGSFVGELSSGSIKNSLSTSDLMYGDHIGLFGGALRIYNNFLTSHNSFESTLTNNPPVIISKSYSVGNVYHGKLYMLGADIACVSEDMHILNCSNPKNCVKANQCSGYESSSDPCYYPGISTSGIYYKNDRVYPQMYNQNNIYIYFKQTLSSPYYVVNNKSVTYNNERPLLLFDYLSNTSSSDTWEERVCTISTGPASTGAGEGTPTKYILPIPKSLPVVPFCNPL